AVAAGRILLERAERETGACSGVHDLAETSRPFGEVALTPVHQAVDAQRDGMFLEEQQLAVGAQRRRDAAHPVLEIGDRQKRTEPGVHEVEATATQLRWQRLRI